MPKQLINNPKLETQYDYTLYNLYISVASTLQIATQNASDCSIDFDRTSSDGNAILTFEHQIEIDLFMFIMYIMKNMRLVFSYAHERKQLSNFQRYICILRAIDPCSPCRWMYESFVVILSFYLPLHIICFVL